MNRDFIKDRLSVGPLDKLFQYMCKTGNLQEAQWLLQVKPDIHISRDAFYWACINGHLSVVQWLCTRPACPGQPCKAGPSGLSLISSAAFRDVCAYGHLSIAQWFLQVKPDIDISADEEHAFQIACQCGHLSVAQWLLQVKHDINISADNEYAFRNACRNGHLSIAQWLLQVKPDIDISARDEHAFRSAYENGHLSVTQWFCTTLNPSKYKCRNHIYIEIAYDTKKIGDCRECPICKEVDSTMITSCNHQFCKAVPDKRALCKDCILSWITKVNTCPYCREHKPTLYYIQSGENMASTI